MVLAVARLFYHLAPAVEAQKIAKPLVRLLRNHREMQYVVLKNIAVMATSRPVSNLIFLSVIMLAIMESNNSNLFASIFLNLISNNFTFVQQNLYLFVTSNLIS